MIGGMLKHIVLAFFLMVAINQISPLAGKITENRCKIIIIWIGNDAERNLIKTESKKKASYETLKLYLINCLSKLSLASYD